MKKSLILSVCLCTALLGLQACSSTDQGDKPKQEQKPQAQKDDRPIEQKLKVGMTKDEVRAAVGNPSGTAMSSDGEESWSYSDHAKAWIPFYSVSGGKFHTTVVTFDKDGKVKSWTTRESSAY